MRVRILANVLLLAQTRQHVARDERDAVLAHIEAARVILAD